MTETTEKFDCWCLVELFGHQKIAGKVTESTLAGGAFVRVDVPAVDGEKAFTRFFGPSAIYSINPTTEEIVMAAVSSNYRNAPVSRYELPKLAEVNPRVTHGYNEEDEVGPPR